MAGFMTKFKEFMLGGEEEYEDEQYGEEQWNDGASDGYVENTGSDWSVQSGFEQEPIIEEPAQAYTTPVYKQPAVSTVVMLSPYDIRTSQIVCDHIREGHIVICNLTSSANNQRVVDYISGGVYAFDGKIEPTAVKTTFVCTPKNVNLIVDADADTAAGTRVSAL